MKKFLSLLLAAMMLVSCAAVLSACGNKEAQAEINSANASSGNLVADFKAVLVGSVNMTGLTKNEGGITYKNEDGKYGIISLDGSKITDAKYVVCTPDKMYFGVSKKLASDTSDIAGLNSCGLINGNGKMLIPESYAAFDVLNERYVQAIQVTKQTTVEDNALVYYSEDDFAVSPGTDDILFEGKWCVYDVIEGKKVAGAEGTDSSYCFAYGNILQYTNAEGNNVYTDAEGRDLSGAKIFDDGSYAIEDREGTVFDSNGDVRFTYDLTGYTPDTFYSSCNYYTASKYADGESSYAVMDCEGNIISADFDNYFTPYGEFIIKDKAILTLDGETAVEGSFSTITCDDAFNKAWVARNDNDVYTFFDSNGTVLCKSTSDDPYSVSSSEFFVTKKTDDDKLAYCFAKSDYTLDAEYVSAPWLAKTDAGNYYYDLINTIDGSTLLESYKSYYPLIVDGTVLIYAEYATGTDIYQIISGDTVDTVAKLQEDLLTELSDAFTSAGIDVTVNKETGELSMDSAILFGGDSAVLSAEGKAYLDKFMKAYTSIVFTDKYENFVERTLVEGHIAPVAGVTYEDGLPLSEERANNVKAYCLTVKTNATGLDEALQPIGYSNSKPVVDENGQTDMDASRRVSFRLILNID